MMAIFNQIDLIVYTQRIELQKSVLPLATVFNDTQKKEIDSIYEQLLAINYDAIAQFLEVKEPIFL